MSMQVTVRYDDVYNALEPLRGIKLRGTISGPPTSKLPLDRIYERFLRQGELDREEYRGVRVTGVKVDDKLYLACHFKLEEGPDDFCIAIEADDAWTRLTRAADQLSRLTNESYTLTLAALIHALQGIIHGEEEEIEEITDPDQVIEELLTWLPEYIAITD